MNSQPTNQPPELPNYLNDLCAVCGGRRGLHNFHNQRCPKDINSSGDHTEYRNTVFTATPPNQLSGDVDHEAEKEVMMQAFDKVYKMFQARSWIMEGRGSYPYNDDRYKEEVRYLYDEFEALHADTWANIKSKSVDFRKKVIEQYKKDLENPYIRLSETGQTSPNQLSGIEVEERIKIVTDKQLEKAWGYANFGDTPKRKVILEALEKITQGYHNGSTATAIVKELKLIEQRNRNYVLTDKGLKYLLAGYAASEGEKDLIIQGLEEGSELWKAEYDNCRAILTELVYLKTLKDTKGKTEEYEQRQPLVWITAKKFLEKYQHQ